MSLTDNRRLSFELFPPKTERGMEKLVDVQEQLGQFKHDFFSVTYGAGGSTRENTRRVVIEAAQRGYNVAPHLSFGADGEDEIKQLIDGYLEKGVSRLVALRGDLPSGFGDGSRLAHANELVSFIRKEYGDSLDLEVAAYPEIHPESDSYQSEIYYLKQKLDAGANSAITQYFYSIDAYRYFIDACLAAGINQPIYPGVMPILNFDNLKRFSSNCGAEIPRWLGNKIQSYDSSEDAKQFCTEFITQFSQQLLDSGAPGLHFYTMNQAEPVASVCKNLGVATKAA